MNFDIQKLIPRLPVTAVLMLPVLVQAHDGHGLTGGHWHVTDAWGFVAFAGLVALALWLTRGDK